MRLLSLLLLWRWRQNPARLLLLLLRFAGIRCRPRRGVVVKERRV